MREMYRKPPSMMIATVDKGAQMAWNDAIRNLFGLANQECTRHGLTWPDCECKQSHNAQNGMPRAETRTIPLIRPPDLIIQDEFHLISGPLGTMVGLYETAVDELSTWRFDENLVRPKIIASTATVRRAREQVRSVFIAVSIFPPNGLDVEDNFFSVQRPIEEKPGEQYLGICSPGSARPAVLIRLYTALLTASQDLFHKFGKLADPWMTAVGYFNSCARTRWHEKVSGGQRPNAFLSGGNGGRRETGPQAKEGEQGGGIDLSGIKSASIPEKLDTLEIQFRADHDPVKGVFESLWEKEETRAIGVVLATNMLSVGVDVNRLGLMLVNGQPKSTAEYIPGDEPGGSFLPGVGFHLAHLGEAPRSFPLRKFRALSQALL